MRRNLYGILIEDGDEELICHPVIRLPDGFLIDTEEAASRIVFCKQCAAAHLWLECANPIIN